MPDFPPIATLGRRICIAGPSNGGKSTLAAALGRKLGIPVIHLDQFRHLPNSDWVQRSDAEFVALHDAAVATEAWVIDGNYSQLAASRFARASFIILLGSDRWSAFFRYLRRTLFQRDRAGSLDGAQDSLKWEMVRWILIAQPKRRAAYEQRLRATGLPMLHLRSFPELRRLYEAWGLSLKD